MPTYFETCCKHLKDFKEDPRLIDTNIVILTWGAGDRPRSMIVSCPKKWIDNSESWYILNGGTSEYMHIYKNTRTRFALETGDPYLLSPNGTLMLGNHITFGIHKLKSKNEIALKTHYTFYTKQKLKHLWMPDRNECNITLNKDVLDVTYKQCEVKNALTKKYVQVPTVSYATTFRKPQLDIINKLVEIIQLGPSQVQIGGSARFFVGGNESLLHNKENWRILHDTIILHPLVALPGLAQVSFIDDQHDQLTCHCDYIFGERKIFAIDKALLV